MIDKDVLNNFLRRFGVELHGRGYINKLLSQRQNKNSLEAQSALLHGEAQTIFDVGANEGLVTLDYLPYFPSASILAFEPLPGFADVWENIKAANHRITFNEIGLFDIVAAVPLNINLRPDSSSMLTSKKLVQQVINIV